MKEINWSPQDLAIIELNDAFDLTLPGEKVRQDTVNGRLIASWLRPTLDQALEQSGCSERMLGSIANGFWVLMMLYGRKPFDLQKEIVGAVDCTGLDLTGEVREQAERAAAILAPALIKRAQEIAAQGK